MRGTGSQDGPVPAAYSGCAWDWGAEPEAGGTLSEARKLARSVAQLGAGLEKKHE